MGSTVGVQNAFLLALAQPAIIALLCTIIIPVLRALRGDHRPLRFYVVLVGSLVTLMAFNLNVKCDNKPASLLLVTTGTVIFAILCVGVQSLPASRP